MIIFWLFFESFFFFVVFLVVVVVVVASPPIIIINPAAHPIPSPFTIIFLRFAKDSCDRHSFHSSSLHNYFWYSFLCLKIHLL